MTRFFMSSAAVALAVAALLSGCTGMSRLDYTRIGSRDGWQRPEHVLAAMDIAPGQRVADIGAGDGYFSFLLAEAVGPGGIVYAVEVDDEALAALERRVSEQGAANVRVVRGTPADPLLPDGSVDRVLLVNTYHHIDERVAYFSRLRRDLAPGASVTNVDMRDDLTGILSLFASEGHWSSLASLRREMHSAGYASQKSLDILAVQTLEVFTPEP